MSISNSVREIGRLTRDPKRKGNAENSPVTYTLAVEKGYQVKEGEPNAEFIDCTLFGKNADNAMKYYKQGDTIAIEGHLTNQPPYTNKDGVKVYPGLAVIVDMQTRLGYGKNHAGNEASGAPVNEQSGMPADEQSTVGNQPGYPEEELPY